MNENKSHHVAWADRVGLNKLWFQDIQACSISYGTEYYPDTVWRFYHDIVNVKNGPNLKQLVDDYIDTVWKKKINDRLIQWKQNHPYQADDQSNIEFEQSCIEKELLPELCYFMKQLLEDNGFGFYESEEKRMGSDEYIQIDDDTYDDY